MPSNSFSSLLLLQVFNIRIKKKGGKRYNMKKFINVALFSQCDK